MSEITEDSTTQKGVVRLGKYELIAPIGSGGMAQVFLARQVGAHAFQKLVVVKTIHDSLVKAQGFIDMLLDEARIAALIKHPNVVDIYDLGKADGQYYIAMEYIAGRPLSGVLGRAKSTGNRLDVLSVAHVIAEASDGLHAAHTLKTFTGEHLNLVHRDVTPGNIMVTYEGGVKLVDFGVAKSLGNINTTQSGQLKGKLGYLSPEQINGLEVTPQTDVFSLGVCLWESLVVARLFKAETAGATIAQILTKECRPPSEFREEVPEELDRISLKAISRDPAERYQSAMDLRDDLHALLRDSNYYQGRLIVTKYMEQQFKEDIEDDRNLISRTDFTVPVGFESEVELSSPRGSADPSVTASSDPITPTAELLAAQNMLMRRLLMAGALGGLLVLVIVLLAFFRGGESDEKAEASVDNETPAVTQVDEFPEPVEMPDAATETAVVEPVLVDAGVEIAVVDPLKPKIKPLSAQAKAKALFTSGKKKLARADIKGAKKDLTAALKLRPGHAGTIKAMAMLYERANLNSKALQFYRKYLKRSPRAKDRKKIEARIRKLGG